MTVRIVVFSGSSGVGKTTIAGELLNGNLSHLVELIVSETTRGPRPDDLPGEYMRRTKEEFEVLNKWGRFLWRVKVGENWYGTREEPVNVLLAKPRKIGLMILTPDKVLDIKNYVSAYNSRHQTEFSVYAMYILSPGEEELERRMIEQGRPEKEIRLRLHDDREWDETARQMGIFDDFLENSADDRGEGAAIYVANKILAFAKELPR